MNTSEHVWYRISEVVSAHVTRIVTDKKCKKMVDDGWAGVAEISKNSLKFCAEFINKVLRHL